MIPNAIRPEAPAIEPFVEPARALPLRWGRYEDRYAWGLILIIGGALHLQGSNTTIVNYLLTGTIAFVVGWSILPARGWRRLVVILPATAQLWILLTGPQSMWTFAILFLCWLVVRHRPPISYLTALLPLGYAFIAPQLFEEYRWMPLALGLGMAVAVASAWLARLIAVSARRRSTLAGTFS